MLSLTPQISSGRGGLVVVDDPDRCFYFVDARVRSNGREGVLQGSGYFEGGAMGRGMLTYPAREC